MRKPIRNEDGRNDYLDRKIQDIKERGFASFASEELRDTIIAYGKRFGVSLTYNRVGHYYLIVQDRDK